jgi:hypothetical protein
MASVDKSMAGELGLPFPTSVRALATAFGWSDVAAPCVEAEVAGSPAFRGLGSSSPMTGFHNVTSGQFLVAIRRGLAESWEQLDWADRAMPGWRRQPTSGATTLSIIVQLARHSKRTTQQTPRFRVSRNMRVCCRNQSELTGGSA